MRKFKLLSLLALAGLSVFALSACGEEAPTVDVQAEKDAAVLEYAKADGIQDVTDYASDVLAAAGIQTLQGVDTAISTATAAINAATAVEGVDTAVDAARTTIKTLVSNHIAGETAANAAIIAQLEADKVALEQGKNSAEAQAAQLAADKAQLAADKAAALKDAALANKRNEYMISLVDASINPYPNCEHSDDITTILTNAVKGLAENTTASDLKHTHDDAVAEMYAIFETLYAASFVEIGTPEEFLAFRNDISEGVLVNVKLTADIDLTGYTVEDYKSNSLVYEGHFFGEGHTIKNASVNCTVAKTAFLFPTLQDSIVKDLRLDAITVTGGSTESHAVLAGLVEGKTLISNVEVTSCMVKTEGNYAALLCARNTKAGEITFEKITVKNSCSVAGSKYTGVLLGDLLATSKCSVTDAEISVNVENSGGQLGAVLGRVRGGDIAFKNIVLREVEATTGSNKAGLFFDGASKCNSVTYENILFMNAKLNAVKQSHLLDGGASAAANTTYTNIYGFNGNVAYVENGTDKGVPSQVTMIDAATATEAWYFETLGLSAEIWEFDGEFIKIKGTSPNRPSEGATLDSIELVTAGVKTSFVGGETFTADGLVVKGKYSDGVVVALKADQYQIDASAVDFTASGEYTVVITSVANPAVSASYNVFVVKVESMVVQQLTIDNLYLVGDTFSTDSVVVIGTLTDGTQKDISKEVTFTHEVNTATAGEYVVTVTYEDLTATYKVTVVENVLTAEAAVVNVVADPTLVDGTLVAGVPTFKTIQAAVDYVESAKLGAVVKTINIGEGKFVEKLTISDAYINLVGQGMDKTVISYNCAAGMKLPNLQGTYGTDGSAVVTVKSSATGFKATGIMFENSYDYLNDKKYADKQALALLVQADQASFYNCGLTSYQDTLETKGVSATSGSRQYFKDCYIAGAVDFIFGTNATTVFDNCEIKNLKRGENQSNGGYIVAPQGCYGTAGTGVVEFGYIFLNCRLTAEEGVLDGSVGLGRPWRTDAMAAYINCEMGAHISKDTYPGAGQSRWEEMNGDSPAVARFYEYGSTGAGAITENVVGGTILTAEQAAVYTIENIFGATNGQVSFSTAWDPTSTELAEDPNVYYYFNGQSSATGTSYTFDGKVEGATGTLGEMAIDATNGKLAYNSAGYTQMNTGTTLTFTAKAGTTVEIESYPGQYNYTVNGVAATANTTVVTCDVDTTIVVEATSTSYIYSIIIKG